MELTELFKIVKEAFERLREYISLNEIIQIKNNERKNEGNACYFLFCKWRTF